MSPLRKTYFELLSMLQRIRHHIDDSELQGQYAVRMHSLNCRRGLCRISHFLIGRIDQLLLPLSADQCSRAPSVVRHAPYRVPHGLRHRSPQSEEEDRKMMPREYHTWPIYHFH